MTYSNNRDQFRALVALVITSHFGHNPNNELTDSELRQVVEAIDDIARVWRVVWA